MTCYDKAVSLLAIREHTEKELKAKLKAKGYSDDDISASIARLKDEKYLSEERFAASFIRSRLRKSPEGKNILLMRLMEKGSPRQVASDAVRNAWEEEAYSGPLIRYASSLIAKKGEEGTKAVLLRKGFTPSEISSCLKAIADEREGIDVE